MERLLNELIAFKNTEDSIARLRSNKNLKFIPSEELRDATGILMIEFRKTVNDYGYQMLYYVNTDFFHLVKPNEISSLQNYNSLVDNICHLYVRSVSVVESGFGKHLRDSKQLKIPNYPNLIFTSKFVELTVEAECYTKKMINHFENCDVTFTSRVIWNVEDLFEDFCNQNNVWFQYGIDQYVISLSPDAAHFSNTELMSAYAYVEKEINKYIFLSEYFRLDIPFRIQFTSLCEKQVNKIIQLINMLYSDLMTEINFEIAFTSSYHHELVIRNSDRFFFPKECVVQDHIYFQTSKWTSS